MITKIKSNIKGHINQSFDSSYVMFMGNNGAGKSSYIHSLELALFSQAFDASNKDVKQKSRLNMMTASGDEYSGWEDDGVYSIATIDGDKDELFSRPTGYLNAIQLASKAMAGGTMALIKFIFDYADTSLPIVDVRHPHWDQIRQRHRSTSDALIVLEPVVSKNLRDYREALKEYKIILKHLNSGLLAEAAAKGEIRRSSLAHIGAEAIEKVDLCKAALNDIRNGLLNCLTDIAPSLEKEMVRYIPDGMGKPAFIFNKNEVYLAFEDRPFPSGAETVCLAAALAAVLLPHARSIFIYPDRAYDRQTLGKIMRVARTIPAQGVYIQCTDTPAGYDPEALGWQLIQIDSRTGSA